MKFISGICSLTFTRQVFSPGKVIFAGVGVLLLVTILLDNIRGSSELSFCISQAAKDVQKGQETLIDVFGRVESFFQRLEIYTQARRTTEMMDTTILIMVEVIAILGIATKEMKQGRISEYFGMCMSPVLEERPEKYGKRLIGRTEMEDALKRLDKLTHEEAWMAIAENLRTTHTVEERVRGVTEQVLAVDNRVAGVDDKLANVDDMVANVNEKVTEVIHGVCKSSLIQKCLTGIAQMERKQGTFWDKRPTM